MTRHTAILILGTAALVALFLGHVIVALFLADVVILLVLAGPRDDARRDARNRNKIHRY